MSVQARRDVFQAIADPTRRAIIGMVAGKAMNQTSLAEHFEMSRPAISQHMKILIECGLVEITTKGRERYCEARVERLAEVADWVEPFREMWEQRFGQLDELLNLMQSPKRNNKHASKKRN